MSEIVRDVSPESLARTNETNLVESCAAFARAYGGEVRDEADLLWCAVGVPSAWWNRVARSQLGPETLDDRIEWVIERARGLRVPFVWPIAPSTRPAGLGEHLLRHGLIDGGESPAMGIALVRLPSAMPALEGVTVERVRDPKTLETCVRTMSAGFGAPPSNADALLSAVSHDVLGDDAAAYFYLAWLEGEPVATAVLTLAAGAAGIYSVTTLEGARRRGVGAAVTMAPLLEARDRGYSVGVLQASEMGYPVYARLGFSEQFRYHNFLWKPE